MLIRGELFIGFKSLLNKQRIELKTVKKIIISGNTTMIHLLMGYSCEGLEYTRLHRLIQELYIHLQMIYLRQILGCLL